MRGLIAVVEKEMADNFTSLRFLILFALIFLAGLSATFVAAQSISSVVGRNPQIDFVFLKLFMASSDKLPLSFLGFITFLGPLVGIALGFDAVNSERANGTLSRVLS